ncbi:hypothetical protein KM043_016308 [Ampulex compressa]|nr:hypothetical protein KM043_016308 [Ampulex compressa]
MRSVYHFKSGQTAENTRPSERSLALIAPRSAFQRFVDYTTATERLAAQKEEDAARLEALKKASYEITKTWDNTTQNIRRKRKDMLLAKAQRAEEERTQFVKDMEEKKVAERAEVLKQARRLLLHRRPQCRRINRALLVSECFKERDAQIALQKDIKDANEEQEREYLNVLKTSIAKYEEDKTQKAEERVRKIKDYSDELKKQIEETERINKAREKAKLEAEKQEQLNMNREMEITKEYEAQELLNKKKRLQQFFKDAIEEKKRFELQMKRDEEYEDRAMQIYCATKIRVRKMHKVTEEKEKAEKEQRAQYIVDKCSAGIQSRETEEEELLRKAVEEKEAAERKKREKKVQKDYARSMAIQESRLEAIAREEKQMQEQQQLKIWELMQRFKRDEHDRQAIVEEQTRERHRKIEYARCLAKDIAEREMEEKRSKILEEEATNMSMIVQKADQQILDYADKVLEESKGVRPVYPILKAVEECKKEMGLIPPKRNYEVKSADTTTRKK